MTSNNNETGVLKKGLALGLVEEWGHCEDKLADWLL
jgi:hypothetical protein